MPSRASSVSTNDPSWNGLRTCGPNHFNFAAWPCRRRGDRVKRREFISLLAGLAACRPKVAHAQHAGMPVVGVVGSGSPAVYAERLALIRRGLEETGFTESRTVAIEYRWAEGQLDRLRCRTGGFVDCRSGAAANLAICQTNIARRNCEGKSSLNSEERELPASSEREKIDGL